jgi:hypothetical protein
MPATVLLDLFTLASKWDMKLSHALKDVRYQIAGGCIPGQCNVADHTHFKAGLMASTKHFPVMAECTNRWQYAVFDADHRHPTQSIKHAQQVSLRVTY